VLFIPDFINCGAKSPWSVSKISIPKLELKNLIEPTGLQLCPEKLTHFLDFEKMKETWI